MLRRDPKGKVAAAKTHRPNQAYNAVEFCNRIPPITDMDRTCPIGRFGPKAVITKVIRSPRRYERPAMEWQEIVCAENPFDFFARKNGAVVPVANKPDF
jgi:hypothetical protein